MPAFRVFRPSLGFLCLVCASVLAASWIALRADARARPLESTRPPEPTAASYAADASGQGGRPEPEAAWIEIDEPVNSEVVTLPVGWVELRGRIGSIPRGYDDLVIALDLSQSSLLPSGLDIDGDGITGKLADPRWTTSSVPLGEFKTWTTDFDDTVVRASLLAVRQLLSGLDPMHTRVGLVRFTADATVVTPIGPVATALKALDTIPIQEDWTGSDLGAAVRRSLTLLEETPPQGKPNQRAIYLVSDGLPTAPRNELIAARRARAVAEFARKKGVPVYTFEMAHIEDPGTNDSEVLDAMASLSGARWTRVDKPSALRFQLPHPARSGGLERVADLQIRNVTDGGAARAIRLFPNGKFDAFVPLAPGLNKVQVTLQLRDGRTVETEHLIDYVPGPQDEAKAKVLLDELKRRTNETKNWLPYRNPPQRKGSVTIEQAPESKPKPTAPKDPEPKAPAVSTPGR